MIPALGRSAWELDPSGKTLYLLSLCRRYTLGGPRPDTHHPTLTGSPLCLLTPTQGGTWSVEKVIQVPPKKVKGWILPEMPSECLGEHGNWNVGSWAGKQESLKPLDPTPYPQA